MQYVLYNCSTTPLHWAAERGDVEQVRLLLDRGAHTDKKDSKWYSNYSLLSVSSCIILSMLVLGTLGSI